MEFRVLSRQKAFIEGSQLWICTASDNCNYSKDLNWYCNFLMTKSLNHEMPSLSAEFAKNLEEFELDQLKPQSNTSKHSLIESSKYLPNRFLLLKKMTEEDLSTWITESLNVWQGLQKPSLRFFLPKGFSTDDFKAAFPKTNYMMDISLVVH